MSNVTRSKSEDVQAISFHVQLFTNIDAFLGIGFCHFFKKRLGLQAFKIANGFEHHEFGDFACFAEFLFEKRNLTPRTQIADLKAENALLKEQLEWFKRQV